MPALFAIGAFCAWRVPAASALLRDNRRSLPLRTFAGSYLAFYFSLMHIQPRGYFGRLSTEGMAYRIVL